MVPFVKRCVAAAMSSSGRSLLVEPLTTAMNGAARPKARASVRERELGEVGMTVGLVA